MSSPRFRYSCRRSVPLRRRLLFFTLGAAIGSCFRGHAADSLDAPAVSITPRAAARETAPARTANIRLDVKNVLVPVTVTDAWGQPVQNLTKPDFRLFEDDVPQDIVSLTGEDVPASIGVIFDASSSMSNKIAASVAAVDQFCKTFLPGDEFLLIRFSNQPHLVSGFTKDISEISSWLHSTRPDGWTALNDAIYLGIQKMKAAHNGRKALLVLSDGGDNDSRYSSNEIRRLVREADVGIYSITFFAGSRLLESISEQTGGRLIEVHKLKQLPDAMEQLSRAIRGQYMLSYYSNRPQNDGKYQRVRVEVTRPLLHVSWRRGYYAPYE